DPRARAPRPRHGRSPALRARERVPADLRPLLRRERQRLRDERPLRRDRLQEEEGREGGQGPARQRGANRRVPEAEEWQAEARDACSRAKKEASLAVPPPSEELVEWKLRWSRGDRHPKWRL